MLCTERGARGICSRRAYGDAAGLSSTFDEYWPEAALLGEGHALRTRKCEQISKMMLKVALLGALITFCGASATQPVLGVDPACSLQQRCF